MGGDHGNSNLRPSLLLLSPTAWEGWLSAAKAERTERSKRERAAGTSTVSSMDVTTFEQEVKSVVDDLPEWVTLEMENVVIVVERNASRDQDPSRDGLLGIYEGIPLPERGFDYFGVAPDRIVIFYEPHLKLRLGNDDLRSEIRTTVLHEVGHHFGFTDERLHDLGWG